MKRQWIVAGYAGDEALPSVTDEDARKLTHLNIAFGHVRDDEIRVDHLRHLNRLPELKAANPDLLILLSVGGWSAGGFSEAAATAAGRASLAQSAANLLRSLPLDGIDLDWEYPCYGEAGIAASPDDKTNFTLLLREMREALDREGAASGRHYLLTIAAGADHYYIDGTEMDKVHPYLDFIQLMTYDMRGGFQTLTGHHTNLYTPTGDLFRISVDASVRLFREAGVPPEKIVIGAAFYSRMWQGVPDRNAGLHQMTASSGGYGPDYTRLHADYIGRGGFVRYWDDEAKAPYLFDGNSFITYDDEESLRHKCGYIRSEGLAGIMFWEYSCDKTHLLLDALHDGLNRPAAAQP
jgi:chitinase